MRMAARATRRPILKKRYVICLLPLFASPRNLLFLFHSFSSLSLPPSFARLVLLFFSVSLSIVSFLSANSSHQPSTFVIKQDFRTPSKKTRKSPGKKKASSSSPKRKIGESPEEVKQVKIIFVSHVLYSAFLCLA